MTTFAGSYFPASYFPPGWSSTAVDTDPGALRASVSGAALAAGSLTARGYLIGAIVASASVQAFITQATGEIVAALAGGASVTGTLTDPLAAVGGGSRRASWNRFRGYDDRATPAISRSADEPPKEYQEPQPVWTLDQALAWLNSTTPATARIHIDPAPLAKITPANAATVKSFQPDIAVPPELEALTEADFDAAMEIAAEVTRPTAEPEDDTMLRLNLLLTI